MVWSKDLQVGHVWKQTEPKEIWKPSCHEQNGSQFQCVWFWHERPDLWRDMWLQCCHIKEQAKMSMIVQVHAEEIGAISPQQQH